MSKKIGAFPLLFSYSEVFETAFFDFLPVVDVSSVEHYFATRELFFHVVPINIPELVPFSKQDNSVAIVAIELI